MAPRGGEGLRYWVANIRRGDFVQRRVERWSECIFRLLAKLSKGSWRRGVADIRRCDCGQRRVEEWSECVLGLLAEFDCGRGWRGFFLRGFATSLRSRNRRLRVFLTAEFQSAPLAKLFAIVFGEIQELDAGALGRFGCPDGANVDVDGFCYAMEAKRNTKDGIEIECDGRGHEKAVLAEVQEHAEIIATKRDVDRAGRGDARIETPLAWRVERRERIGGGGHDASLPYSQGIGGAGPHDA
jgi:hypothetical protein